MQMNKEKDNYFFSIKFSCLKNYKQQPCFCCCYEKFVFNYSHVNSPTSRGGHPHPNIVTCLSK